MTLNCTERLLRACRGEPVDRPPVWLMRQAGRYLPEYRAVRSQLSFLELCRDVERAVEVSLQPLERVGTEAVILFSDILIPVIGAGVAVDFAPGPVIAEPFRTRRDVERLSLRDPRDSVPYVLDIVRRLRGELEAARVPLIGFAGAPFTLAAYLVEGKGSKSFTELKRLMVCDPDTLRALLERLTDLVVAYLQAQVEAGAQVVQLFDTWAGILAPRDYRSWVLPFHRAIAERLDRSRAPFILYVKDGAHVLDEMIESGADVLSLDWRVELEVAVRRVRGRVSLQGNLDPAFLFAQPEQIAARVRELAAAAAPARGHILNLGHGCLPETPVTGVRAFVEAAKALAGSSSQATDAWKRSAATSS